MSSRALKKLQSGKEKDLIIESKDSNDDDQLSEDDDELETARKKHLNPFDLVSSYNNHLVHNKVTI